MLFWAVWFLASALTNAVIALAFNGGTIAWVGFVMFLALSLVFWARARAEGR